MAFDKNNVFFTKKGNAVGFTANGTVVHGKYLSKSKSWVVDFGEHPSLTDARRQLFAFKREAEAYAASMMDEAKTAELAWW